MSGDSHARRIPITEHDHLTSQLQLARVETRSGQLSSTSFNNIPTAESPFNPIIHADVQYSPQPIITNRNRCLTRYENRNRNNADIALYDTRVRDLNALDVPGLANNTLYNDLMNRARDKIEIKHGDRLALAAVDSSSPSTNGGDYNPFLPYSGTNTPAPGRTPIQVDDRMMWYTNERPWTYESDRVAMAMNLQHSPHIQERNMRQQAADDALNNRHHVPRWNEAKGALFDRPDVPNYTIDDHIRADADRNGTPRQQLSAMHAVEAFGQRRTDGYDETNTTKMMRDVEARFIPEYARQMRENHLAENVRARLEQYTPPVDADGHLNGEVKGWFTTFIDRIGETVRSFFTWNAGGSKNVIRLEDTKVKYDDDGSIMIAERAHIYDNTATIPQFERRFERFKETPTHMLVVRDGEIPSFFPDTNHDYTAVTCVQGDALGTGLVRTMVLVDDAKMRIIQKHEQDAIFSGDNRPFGEDYLSIDVPLAMVDDKLRERIRKYNYDTLRDKVIELTYDDFVALSEFVVKHPEAQQRLKREELWKQTRSNRYDEEIATNFEGRKTFMDEKVYSIARADGRHEKQVKANTGRIDRDQTVTAMRDVEPMMTAMPIGSMRRANEVGGEMWRGVQHNDTPFATQRSGRVRMEKFNS